MSAVQFRCHFWPFNFTYGCIVCLAGPWIREPFLESCWDKNLGTATPHSSSDRRWQTKGHQDENRLHCAFKAWAAESDCSGGSGFVIFQREPLFPGSCAEAWYTAENGSWFLKDLNNPEGDDISLPRSCWSTTTTTPLFLEISAFHYLNLEKHKNMNMLSHLSFPFFSPFLLQTHRTDAFRKPRRFLLPVLLHE